MGRARRSRPGVGLILLATIIVGGGFVAALSAGPSPHGAAHPLAAHHRLVRHRHRAPSSTQGNRALQLGAKVADLPAATTAPAAAPAALVSAPPLANRENFAFAPYWTLGQSPTFDLDGLSTLAYFSIGVNPNGTLDESGPGWNGYQSQDLANLITRAHAEGERVVLTVNDFGQSSLDSLTSSPTAAGTLSAALIPLLEAKNLDGVNLDFEGEGSHDQAGLTTLVAALSGALRAADPHWQITLDTYASSAGDTAGFYNIPALAPSVDAFFVMAYELNLSGTASAVSPLTSGMFSDLTTLEQYTAAVPASKVILGTPFFGIDWPTSNGTLGATATGPATDIADAQAQAPANPLYWDPVTESGWTSYLTGTQWHESFFESPYALFEVAHLAGQYAVRGVGIWALGMESEGPQMIAALDGFAPAGGPGSTGPQSTTASAAAPGAISSTAPTTTSPTAATTTTKPAGAVTTTTVKGATVTTTTVPVVTTATYNGKTVTLNPTPTSGLNTLFAAGSITGFTSTNPAWACLSGKTLTVYKLLSGARVAVATTPAACVNQQFTFTP